MDLADVADQSLIQKVLIFLCELLVGSVGESRGIAFPRLLFQVSIT